MLVLLSLSSSLVAHFSGRDGLGIAEARKKNRVVDDPIGVVLPTRLERVSIVGNSSSLVVESKGRWSVHFLNENRIHKCVWDGPLEFDSKVDHFEEVRKYAKRGGASLFLETESILDMLAFYRDE